MNTLNIAHAAPVTYTSLPVRSVTANVRAKVEELKSSLTQKFNEEYSCVGERLVYQAVNEADALASLTTVPLLFLPALAEEKVQQAGVWAIQQCALDPQSKAFELAA